MKSKSISTIGKGYVIYPTNIFERYNNYLINEYNNFLSLIDSLILVKNSTEQKKLVKKYSSIKIDELKKLLESNTNCDGDITKLLNVTSWEEELDYFYTLLNNTLKKYNLEQLKSKNYFLRREKLERLK